MKDSKDESNGGVNDEQSTSVDSSLLNRLKLKSPEAWRRLVYLFGPLVYQQCRQNGLQAADATDVVQEVFQAVAASIASFRRDRPGDTFRGWLWTITRNKIVDHWHQQKKRPEALGGSEAQEWLKALPATEPAELAELGTPETPGSLYQRALQLIRDGFEERTWKAFWRVAVDGSRPADVAEELSISVNAVYIAKTRVLRRLRQELGDVLD